MDFFLVLNKNLLYCFYESIYGKRLNSSGRDFWIFTTENLDADIP